MEYPPHNSKPEHIHSFSRYKIRIWQFLLIIRNLDMGKPASNIQSDIKKKPCSLYQTWEHKKSCPQYPISAWKSKLQYHIRLSEILLAVPNQNKGTPPSNAQLEHGKICSQSDHLKLEFLLTIRALEIRIPAHSQIIGNHNFSSQSDHWKS